MSAILEIQALSKKYGRLQAVNDLSLKVEAGQIYGILGPNGSGKTTTLAIILGVIHASQGKFSWFGQKPTPEQRQNIGSILETPNFYPYLSALKNLQIVAEIKRHGKERILEVLKEVNLYERRKDPIKNYSLGMKQRLALAAALLPDPDVLVLDEPTNGLDPQGIADVRHIIREKGQQGKTIILASHILDEVEKTCTHVAVIKKGRLLSSGSIDEVLTPGQKIRIAAADLKTLEQVIKDYKGIQNISQAGTQLELQVEESVDPAQLNRHIFEQGIMLSHLQVIRKDLEATFLELTAEDKS